MYYIDIKNEFEKLLHTIMQLDVENSQLWKIQNKASLSHWQDLVEQLEQAIAEESIYFDAVNFSDDFDVYQYMDQEMIYKNLCSDLTYLIRLAYDLGVEQQTIILIYQHILNLWLGYADLISHIQNLGQMQGTNPLILEVDYATALLLFVCAIQFEGQHDVSRIVEGLLSYQSDRLLDILSYPYFENQTISENYHVDYPFQLLNPLFANGVNEQSIRQYLTAVEKDQDNGQFYEKKRFHRIAVLGKWRFEIVALCTVYQIDMTL